MNRILKAASYAAAPKLTFTALNPKKAAVAKAGQWALGRVMPSRRRPSYGRMAMKGIGAAAIALPVGMWIGRRARG
jgi:hypothetical protein